MEGDGVVIFICVDVFGNARVGIIRVDDDVNFKRFGNVSFVFFFVIVVLDYDRVVFLVGIFDFYEKIVDKVCV